MQEAPAQTSLQAESHGGEVAQGRNVPQSRHNAETVKEFIQDSQVITRLTRRCAPVDYVFGYPWVGWPAMNLAYDMVSTLVLIPGSYVCTHGTAGGIGLLRMP